MTAPWTPAWFSGKRVTVMGLGLHGGGLAVATWMLQHGADVTVTDLKSRAALAPSVRAVERAARARGSGALTLTLGCHRAADMRTADLVVQNPGVPRQSPYLAIAQRAGAAIENEASLFLRMVRASVRQPSRHRVRVIAVTGTRGKSTTAALIASILGAGNRRVFLAGNMRIPMFGELDAMLRAVRRCSVDIVLELSSWHCERLTAATGSVDVAVMTNVLRDHLNRYHSMRAYVAAKARLVRFQARDAVAVLYREDLMLRAIAASYGHTVRWYSDRRMRAGVGVVGAWFTEHNGARMTRIAHRTDLGLPGMHNTRNACAAIAAARVLGASGVAIRRGLRVFRGLPGRLEVIARRVGVTYVNDTCATTPDAVIAALQALASGTQTRPCILIAGGTDKELLFDGWARVVARSVRVIIFLPGSATVKMERALGRVRGAPPAYSASSMRAAVRVARRLVQRGDTVLLSPGAASFGLFQHEFDRGDQFVHAVRAAG